MAYSSAAVEHAMTIHQALLHALHGRQPWLQVADVIGLSPRTVRRWRWRLERHGVQGLLDRRRRTPSPRRVPLAELQRVLRLYRERYQVSFAKTPSGRQVVDLSDLIVRGAVTVGLAASSSPAPR